jgi:uncharacterized protein YuzE
MQMYVTYDEEADVLFAKWGTREPGDGGGSRDFGFGRFVEFDAHGKPVAVEFLDASHGVDLAGIPNADEIRAALRRLGALIEAQVGTPA